MQEKLSNSPDQRVRDAGLTIKEGFNALVDELKAGHTEHFLQYLQFQSRFHQYSPNNQLLIFMQRPQASLVAGYRKWQEWGYQVKQGETGIGILAPVIVKTKQDTLEGKTIEGQALVGYKVVKVFDASQLTEKVKEADLFSDLPDDADEQSHLVLRTIDQQGIIVLEKKLAYGTQGMAKYDQLDKGAAMAPVIVLNEGLTSRAKTAVAIHEWAHHLIHFDSLIGKVSDAAKALPLAVREAQVEACAYIVCKHLGVEPPMSSDYILLYKNNAEVLMDNLTVIQSTSHKMILELQRVAQEVGVS